MMKKRYLHRHTHNGQTFECSVPKQSAEIGDKTSVGIVGCFVWETYSCVDFTIEKPRFSDVWKLEAGQLEVRTE
jgi:hypothetical protein